MTIKNRLSRLEGGRQIIVVNLNDYAAEITQMGMMEDEKERKMFSKSTIERMNEDYRITPLDIVIYTTLISDIDVPYRYTIYHDRQQAIMKEYETTPDLTWQEVLKTNPIVEVMGQEAIREARERRRIERLGGLQ